jgi:hypothetical protein
MDSTLTGGDNVTAPDSIQDLRLSSLYSLRLTPALS